jgi:hypothetical protein
MRGAARLKKQDRTACLVNARQAVFAFSRALADFSGDAKTRARLRTFTRRTHAALRADVCRAALECRHCS